jgi:hypothetical protein
MDNADRDRELLDRADRFLDQPGGERERRRLLRMLGDRQAAVQARIDQQRARLEELRELGRFDDDLPPAA